MSDYTYPGSTKVVTWKDNLPEWMDISNVVGRESVTVEIEDELETMTDRYYDNRVCRSVINEVFERRSSFTGLTFEESMEKVIDEMDHEYFSATVEEVEERL